MRRIAVLMTCYNRVETTLRCLRSLFSQTLVQSSNPTIPNQTILDVWLVDDASPDGTGEKVKTEFPQVNVIRGTGKLFWSKGMRLAWDTAAAAKDYDFYLWLNDDVELYPAALEGALADYDRVSAQNPRSAIFGTLAESPGSVRISYGYNCREGEREKTAPSGRPQRIVGLVCGNFVLIPRAVHEAAGRIYGGYRHAGGDVDYGLVMDRTGCAKVLASAFVGWCAMNGTSLDATIRALPLMKRIALLWNPRGRDLHDAFVFRRRNNGLLRAIVSCAHVALTVVFAPVLQEKGLRP